jgi:hypothetical protein
MSSHRSRAAAATRTCQVDTDKLQIECRARDLAMFNLAIDSKRVAVMSSPCGLRMSPEADIRRIAQRFGKKTERPTRFNLSKRSRRALDDYLKVSGKRNGELLFNGHRGPDRSEGLCCQSQTFGCAAPMAVSCVTNHALHQNFGRTSYGLAGAAPGRLITGTLLKSGVKRWRKSMKVVLKRIVIATSTVACVALLSFSWSEHHGVWLGVESAEARVDRPSTPVRVAGVARRQSRRSVSGDRLLAAVVAATTSPRNYDDYDCYDNPYAGRGYPPGYYYSSYPGGYCVSRGYATGLYARPTLFPRYYGDLVR